MEIPALVQSIDLPDELSLAAGEHVRPRSYLIIVREAPEGPQPDNVLIFRLKNPFDAIPAMPGFERVLFEGSGLVPRARITAREREHPLVYDPRTPPSTNAEIRRSL